jgi:hypothetical protein
MQLELSLPGSTAAVTIGGGDNEVTLDGNNASGVLSVDSGVQATLENLTITHGNADTSDGGGIYNRGTLTLSHSTLSANYAIFFGGAIYNSSVGMLTVSNSTLSANSASFDSIHNAGTLTVANSTISANSGGGFTNDAGTLTVANSTISANSGGGFANRGTLTVTNSTISADSDTGIFNSGTLTVSNSTLSGNSGSGIDNRGTLTVSNSTISSNSFGGGIYSSIFGTLHLQNTIVAGNQAGGGPGVGPDINGPVDGSSSYNLVGDGTGLSCISNGSNGNQIGTPASPIDPLLAPLGDYGGPTQTMPLLPGSPALNAGDPAQAGVADQRGAIRSGGVNIGAFQASASAIVVTAPDTATAGVAFDVSVAVVDVFGQVAVGYYTGTIHFTTTDPDPGVILPPDYTFQASDGGVATFSAGVTLFTPGEQALTVTDLDSGLTGSTLVTL